MVDPKVLKHFDCTPERLEQLYTAIPPSDTEVLSEEERERRMQDCEHRQKMETWIQGILDEGMNFSLSQAQLYRAVDLAFDAAPINKFSVPLMMFAQGRINNDQCIKAVKDLPGADQYVTKDTKGTATGISVPKFYEVNFNYIRSVITRRLAAQANKYGSLWPYYKYEPRSTTQVGKLRADIMSQVAEIMADQFDFRHHDTQVERDAMLYAHSVDFVRSSWEKEEQIALDDSGNPDLAVDGKPAMKTVVVKQGVGWVNPRPERTGWDKAYPLATLNTDSGIGHIYFWDVVRAGDVMDNPKYWNRTNIEYSSSGYSLFTNYADYFSQYYCTISLPRGHSQHDWDSQGNDRLNQLGKYASDRKGESMVLANVYRKIVPKDFGIGTYPHPVWFRYVTAGARTILYAEPLPSTPGAYLGINENDSRHLSCSIAMELMPYQDQISQLLTALLIILSTSNFRVFAINKDIASPEDIERFRKDADAQNRFPTAFVLEYSLESMSQALPSFRIESFINMIETKSPSAIPMIFEAIAQLIRLAERLMALSPQELGQPAPSGISATETNLIGATTETVYGFISDAIDEFRSAKKRICHDAYMAFGAPTFRVPAMYRYPLTVVRRAGFDVVKEDEQDESSEDQDRDLTIDPSAPVYHTITGSKSKLVYEYVYTSRDGALRSVNTQSAQVLVQLLNVLKDPIILQKMMASEKYMEKYFEIINEIFRLSGAGVDLKLDMDQGDMKLMGPGPEEKINQLLTQLTEESEQTGQQIQQLAQQVQQLMQLVGGIDQRLTQVEQTPEEPPIDDLKVIKTTADLELAQRRDAREQERHVVDLGLKAMEMPGDGPAVNGT